MFLGIKWDPPVWMRVCLVKFDQKRLFFPGITFSLWPMSSPVPKIHRKTIIVKGTSLQLYSTTAVSIPLPAQNVSGNDGDLLTWMLVNRQEKQDQEKSQCKQRLAALHGRRHVERTAIAAIIVTCFVAHAHERWVPGAHHLPCARVGHVVLIAVSEHHSPWKWIRKSLGHRNGWKSRNGPNWARKSGHPRLIRIRFKMIPDIGSSFSNSASCFTLWRQKMFFGVLFEENWGLKETGSNYAGTTVLNWDRSDALTQNWVDWSFFRSPCTSGPNKQPSLLTKTCKGTSPLVSSSPTHHPKPSHSAAFPRSGHSNNAHLRVLRSQHPCHAHLVFSNGEPSLSSPYGCYFSPHTPPSTTHQSVACPHTGCSKACLVCTVWQARIHTRTLYSSGTYTARILSPHLKKNNAK